MRLIEIRKRAGLTRRKTADNPRIFSKSSRFIVSNVICDLGFIDKIIIIK